MKNLFLIAIVFVLCTTSCKRYYQISDFEQLTQDHKEIAILPFEIYTFGHVPKKLTPEMIEEIERTESTTFQSNFFSKVLASTRKGERPLQVSVQHYSQTNSLLKENGLEIKDTWTKNPEELAQMLGVDAVVKARVEKDQYFSDGLSAGLELSQTIISIFAERNPFYFNSRNKEVVSDYALISNDGTVLWSIGYRNTADWQVQADQLVATINRRSTRHFPYRE